MRRLFTVTLVAGLLLAAGACGSKEETTSTADQPSARSSEASTTTEKTSDDEKSTTTEKTSDDETDLSLPDPDDLSKIPGISDECAAITTIYMGVLAQSGVLLNPASVDDGELDKLLDQMEEAKSEIPDEIAEDFEIWSEAWTEFVKVMQEIGGTEGMMNPANLEKIEAASDKLDSDEVTEANERIDAYLDEECSGT